MKKRGFFLHLPSADTTVLAAETDVFSGKRQNLEGILMWSDSQFISKKGPKANEMMQYKSSLVPKDYGAKETMESLGAKDLSVQVSSARSQATTSAFAICSVAESETREDLVGWKVLGMIMKLSGNQFEYYGLPFNQRNFDKEHMAGHAGFTDIPDDNELFVLKPTGFSAIVLATFSRCCQSQGPPVRRVDHSSPLFSLVFDRSFPPPPLDDVSSLDFWREERQAKGYD
ncbi:hypothetical protein MG293_008025 [Ovis ammon polii]|uniref:Uncharacterized protein n=1 Tax=Ovis ammon polii TaxID=230172 RepID=A0AAD4YAL6_OVIAM|nr:hypothetical protein MG293_008025 [Ovis ammon polii]